MELSYIVVYILIQFLEHNLANNCTVHGILQSSEPGTGITAKNKINRPCPYEAVIQIETTDKKSKLLKYSILNRMIKKLRVLWEHIGKVSTPDIR